MLMKHTEKSSADRRTFFGILGAGAAAAIAAAFNPLRLFAGRHTTTHPVRSSVTITPNPMAVQRTSKGAAHNG